MKKFYSILLILLALKMGLNIERPFAVATYYFSTADGDDSRTSVQAQNPATPWKTIAKLNSFFTSLNPGDAVRFKRGDTFPGGIVATKSGTGISAIRFATYGSGDIPVISGLTSVSSWTSIGTNLWQSTSAVSTLSSLNMVLISGSFAPIGKFPTSGYSTINSSTAGTSLTSTSLSGTSFTGGQVVIRKNHWILDKSQITSQSGTTINFTNPTSYNIQNNWGFFIQNHQNACDVQNEWWYDATSKKIGMYSSGTPASVQVSSVDNLLNIGSSAYLIFDSIAFKGSNSNTVLFSSGNNIDFEYCDLSYSGINAITATSAAHHITVNGCTAERTNNNFIAAGAASNWSITNNFIHNTAQVAGMGNSSDGQYIAMYNLGPNSLIQYNRVVKTGYNGIDFRGSSNIVSNNLVDTFCNVKDDGAGIYSYTGPTTTIWAQRYVTSNIVLNAVGAGAGTTSPNSDAHGIYMDGNSSQVTISGNTVANCGGVGIFLNANHDITLTNNTFYNNALTAAGTYAQMYEVFPTVNFAAPVRNLVVTGNKFISRTSTQLVAQYRTNEANMSQWPLSLSNANFNNNYYARPINQSAAIIKVITSGSTSVTNISGWTTLSGANLDNSSSTSPVTISDVNDLRFEYNATNASLGISLGGNTYKDVTGATFSGTLTLPAYSSAVLIKTAGSGNSSPTANAGTDISITLPTNSVTLSGSGNDADGTISSYHWTKISGPASFNIASPDAASTPVNSLTTGVYQFQLQVTDNGSATGTDIVQVTVNGGNAFPESNAGTDITITAPAASVHLSGSGTDPDGTISSYAWTKLSGPLGETIVTPTTAGTDVNGLVPGVYDFRLTVTDNMGGMDHDDITVTVRSYQPGQRLIIQGFRYSMITTGDSLFWTTQNEQDIKSFSIQQSVDGSTWTDIASKTPGPGSYKYFAPFKVQSVCLRKIWNWCVQKKTSYVVTHYWYRVRALDSNGVATYSTIIKT